MYNISDHETFDCGKCSNSITFASDFENIINMKSRVLRSVILLGLFAFATAFLSSCNKGYGCPNEFSVDASADYSSVQDNV